MDKTKTVKTRKTPTPAFAVISFLVIVAVLVALINLGVDSTMSVFIAALIAVVIATCWISLGRMWKGRCCEWCPTASRHF